MADSNEPSMLKRMIIIILFIVCCSATTSKTIAANYYSDKIAVLIYHHISNEDTSSVTITTELFEKQLVYLINAGYHFITMEQFREFVGGKPIPQNAILITFDDGYKSFYTNAYPILKKYDLPAVNFLITSYLDNSAKSYVPTLSRKDISEMSVYSKIEFQCHSHALHEESGKHSSLLTNRIQINGILEDYGDYDRRIIQDTENCKREIGKFSRKPDAYSFPFGFFNTKVQEKLEALGIRYAFTTKEGIVDRKVNFLEIPRINTGSPYVTPQVLKKIILKNTRS